MDPSPASGTGDPTMGMDLPKELPMELEEFVDLGVFLTKEPMQTQLRYPEPRSLVNDTVDDGKRLVLSPVDIPEDVWALLNDLEDTWEGDMARKKYDQPLSTPTLILSSFGAKAKDTSARSETTQSNSGLLSSEGNELFGELKTCTTIKNANLNESNGNADLAPPSTNQLINTFQADIEACAIDLPVSFTNFDFPLEVNTPDLDVGMLMSASADLLATPAPVELLSSGSESRQNEQSTEPSQDVSVNKSPDAIASPKSTDGILKLAINNTEASSTGNGAKLQMKRKFSNSECMLDVQETKMVANGANNPIATIIVAFVDSNQILDANVQINNENLNADFDGVTFAKRMHIAEKKEAELRRKNNEASRRSRLSRKTREKEMALLADKLQRQNKLLQTKVDHLTKLRDTMKTELIKLLHKKD